MRPPTPFPLNGINATTGQYLPAPESLDALYAAVTARPALTQVLNDPHYEDLKAKEERATAEPLGLAAGIDHKKLEQTGWGVILPFDAPPALLEALRPLLEHRQAEAGKKKAEFYREFGGPRFPHLGYRPGETKPAFLKRLGRATGQPADPRRGVPYYLLLVGSPRQIPWRFQYDLDVEYAVGRIYFEAEDGSPDYEAYHRYAQSVVLAETAPGSLPRSAAFFATNHDPATRFSCDDLVRPLLAEVAEWEAGRQAGWQLSQHLAGDAKKGRLAELLGGSKTPTLLFTASHGAGFESGDKRQVRHQGALVCQDIGPLRGDGPVSEEVYFSGDDLPSSARLHGLISFHFACFGAGTPEANNFPDPDKVFRGQQLAPFPFAALLPQRLLAHPNGGALAFVGHVDRAWTCSFLLGRIQQTDTFSSLLKDLLDEAPLGHAVEFFNERYAALATSLTSALDDVRFGLSNPDEAFKAGLASTWLEHSDARNYVIFGDPAVRLRTTSEGASPRADLSSSLRPLAPEPPAEGSPLPAGTGSPPPAPPKPPTADTPVPFDADQIAAAEQRYDELLGASPQAFAAPTTVDLLRRNGRDRLVRRFRRLGMTADQAATAADHILGAGDGPLSFATGPSGGLKEVGLERILGKNELLEARYLDLGLAAARAVGRVNIRGRQRGYGTGFLVSPRLLLTNNHVLRTADAAAASFVEFNYQDGPDGQPLPILKVELDPAAFFVTDGNLDFTLVAIRPSESVRAEVAGLGYLPLAHGNDTFVVGECVTIIQHPNGERKQIALRDNQVIGESGESFLHYRTGTMPGSSGSPVFNDEFELVGLHHSGVPRRDPQTRAILTRDGKPWQAGMGEDQVDWLANEGVLIPALLRFLDRQELSAQARGLLAELRAATREGPGQARGAPEAVPQGQPGTPGEVVITPGVGATTITVPVGMTVRITVAGPSGSQASSPSEPQEDRRES